MTITEEVTLIGIGVTFLVGIINLIITKVTANKTLYINTITRLRSEWLYKMKDYFAQYLSAIESHKNRSYENQDNLLNNLYSSYIIIKLNLNSLDTFDRELIDIMENINNDIKRDFTVELTEETKEKVQLLITKIQCMTKIEWEGIKLESKKGNLKDNNKKELRKKYLQE